MTMQDTAGTRQRMEQFSNADNPERVAIRDLKYLSGKAMKKTIVDAHEKAAKQFFSAYESLKEQQLSEFADALAAAPQAKDIDYDNPEAIALMDMLDAR